MIAQGWARKRPRWGGEATAGGGGLEETGST